jgi:AcrR family transcriptional regulator
VADVPVGNVYYYFKTKDDLIGAVVHTYADQLASMLAELERAHPSPKTRLEAFVGVLAERAAASVAQYGAQYGCPYGTLSSELAKKADRPDALAAQLIQIQLDWGRTAARRHEPTRRTRPRGAADGLLLGRGHPHEHARTARDRGPPGPTSPRMDRDARRE